MRKLFPRHFRGIYSSLCNLLRYERRQFIEHGVVSIFERNELARLILEWGFEKYKEAGSYDGLIGRKIPRRNYILGFLYFSALRVCFLSRHIESVPTYLRNETPRNYGFPTKPQPSHLIKADRAVADRQSNR